MSNNDYDNRPFSSKAVLVKIEDKSILKKINAQKNILLRDHSPKKDTNITEIEEFASHILVKSNYEENDLYKILLEIDRITKISIILNKIKTEVDKHYDVLILKD
jgi:hypothetical protein